MTSETYPKLESQDDLEIGCKVEWRIYSDKADADKAAEFATSEAHRRMQQGYDFGYCCPGSIERTKDGRFRVCCP